MLHPEERPSGRHASDRVSARVHVAVQQLRLLVSVQRGAGIDPIRRNERMVPEHDGHRTVRTTADVVRTVLTDGSRVPHNDLARVGRPVPVRIGQPEQVSPSILGIGAVGVERGAVKPDTLAILDLVAHDLLRLEESVAVLVQQPGRVAAFLGDHRTPEGIERNLNQGSDLVGIGNRFDDESGGHLVRALKHRFGELTAEREQCREGEGSSSHSLNRF